MTDETKPLENSAEEPESAPPTASAPAAAAAGTQVLDSTVAKKPGRPRAWWILTSAAGVALLVIGLLGGILIGQAMHGAGQQGRTAQVFIEHGQSGKLDQIPQRLKDRFQQRQDNRQNQNNGQGQSNQQPPTPAPNDPSTGNNG